MLTLRELVAVTLNGNGELKVLGLPDNAVFQADTVDTPQMRPFLVIRWLRETPGIGPVSRRPFELLGYDTPGDFNRIDRILFKSDQILTNLPSTEIEGGWLARIESSSNTNMRNAGLGRGDDLWDEGYKAIVRPWTLRAIASGV